VDAAPSAAVQRQIRGRAASRRLDRFIGVSNYITDRHLSAGIVDSDAR
jgi:hypothetical protein